MTPCSSPFHKPGGRRRSGSVAVALAAAGAVLATTRHAMSLEHGVSVGAPVLYTAMVDSPWRLGASLQYDLEIGAEGDAPGWLHLGAGLRGLGPLGGATVPLETYNQVHLVGAIGPWLPAAGLEFGLTGLFRPVPRVGESSILAEEHDDEEGFMEQRDDPGPLYWAFSAALVRFALGSLRLAAGEAHVGTSILRPGSAFRFQLDLVHLGWMP